MDSTNLQSVVSLGKIRLVLTIEIRKNINIGNVKNVQFIAYIFC